MEIKKNNNLYEAPAILVVDINIEGVICGSGDPEPYSNPFGTELTW